MSFEIKRRNPFHIERQKKDMPSVRSGVLSDAWKLPN
jgi:hypothetical protein